MDTRPIISPWEILKKRVLNTVRIRDIDRRAVEDYCMNSLVLMENAATQCVHWIRQKYTNCPKTVVLCGPGNNGGDGIVISRHLRAYGWDCQCCVLGTLEKLSADARANAQILLSRSGAGLNFFEATTSFRALDSIKEAELVIDAMLGTGASGNPRPPMAVWVEAANRSQAARLAIDIPTGINADTGEVGLPYFRTDATLTFVALKPAMVNLSTAALFGEIEVLPIGIPEQLIHELLTQFE